MSIDDAALELAKYPPGSPDYQAIVAAVVDPSQLTILKEMAKNFREAALGAEPSGSGPPPTPPDRDLPPVETYDEGKSPGGERPLFELYHAQELAKQVDESGMLVRGRIGVGDLVVFFADPGGAKTATAMGIAYAVASGTPWMGCEVKQGPVIYLNGEGQSGFGKRLKALEIHNGGDLSELPFYASRAAVSLYNLDGAMMISEAIDRVIDDDSGAPPALVVIDTLTRFMGANENATEDMTQFVNHVDQHIRRRFGCAVIIVHHSGQADKNRARGSIVLKAAADFEYKLAVDDGTVTMSCTKVKDHDLPPDMAMDITAVTLPWADEYGNPINSIVLQSADPAAVREPTSTRLSKRQHQALAILADLEARHRDNLDEAGHNPDHARVTLEDWRHQLDTAGLLNGNRTKQSWFELRRSLESRRLIEVRGIHVKTRQDNGATVTN